MADREKLALVEVSLERAAESIGDITQPVMDMFHARCPEGAAAFAHHGFDDPARLEALMVENVLYCLMTWFERPEEIRILFYSSVPHHMDTLHVPAHLYRELMFAGIDTITRSIPADCADEIAAWQVMRQDFADLVTTAME